MCTEPTHILASRNSLLKEPSCNYNTLIMRRQIWREVSFLLRNKAFCHLISKFGLLQQGSGGSPHDSGKLGQTNHWLLSSLRSSSSSLFRTSLSLSAFSPRRSHGHSFVFLFLPFLVLLGHNSVTRGLISALIASPGSRVLYNTRDRVPQGLRRAAVCLWHLSSINLYGGWMQPNATCCPHLSGPRRSIKPGERMRTYKFFLYY